MNAEKLKLIYIWLHACRLKFQNIGILNNFFFFFNMSFWFLSRSEKKVFGLSSDRQIRTIHCIHNYLELKFNSKLNS